MNVSFSISPRNFIEKFEVDLPPDVDRAVSTMWSDHSGHRWKIDISGDVLNLIKLDDRPCIVEASIAMRDVPMAYDGLPPIYLQGNIRQLTLHLPYVCDYYFKNSYTLFLRYYYVSIIQAIEGVFMKQDTYCDKKKFISEEFMLMNKDPNDVKKF